MKCREIIARLEELSPKSYACEWDNVGLLVGRKEKEIKKIMISLDASREVVSYAVREKVDMLITHHPMIFSPVKQVNEDQFTSDKILTLAENGICYYAMHTNFDTVGGMAKEAAGEKYLNLSETSPIVCEPGCTEGMGRYGKLPHPMTAQETAAYVKEKFDIPFVMLYQSRADKDKVFERIAVLPGSGKSEMREVKEQGYSLYLTGDFGHHEGMDAMDMGLTVIDATHYGLEHIFITFIRNYLADAFGEEMLEIIEADMGCPVQVL
ncbi:MAG: Nif3-like dinuclear metal center hexameric protein [Lachnospiraceae bacterium]